jgi:threonine/homoserine/homoserine lactone efflux protein
MDVLTFVATVILITVSGALAPGPLFFATLSHGAKSGAKSGLVFSVAHTLIEFALVMLLALGLLTVANKPIVKLTTGIAGGIVLLVFGAVQIRSAFKSKSNDITSKEVKTRNLFLIGLAFTGLNPFFIFWWLTVGANLILLALEFASLAGVVFMYVSHVWIDYAWLTLVAYFAKMGTNIVGLKWYRAIIAIFGVVLIYFGLIFLTDSLS